ncbi:MAG: DUF4430 domain-containing protein [Oscillospiraceae bacterium]|nr:DUF4430 domain-containing protein [Oscillospiraceae bacterium]
MQKFKKVKGFIPVIFMFLLFVTACGESKPPDASGITAVEIGQGKINFRFEVTDDKEETLVWNVSTNEITIGAALLEAELISGDVGEYGLEVLFVNGIRADFNEDKAYWAFYVDGEYAMTGVDSTDIEAGKTYAFVYTPA